MTRMREKMGKYSNSTKSIITGLFLLLFTIVSTGFILPGSANAEEEGYGPGTDKWKFSLGGYFPSIETKVKIDGSQVGDILDLEGLGLSDDDTLWRLDGYWRFAQKHRLAFGYYGFGRDGSIAWRSDPINIGDDDEGNPIVIQPGFLVNTELNLDFYTIQYMYSYFQGEKWELSAGLGAYWIDLEFSIGASIEIDTGTPIADPFLQSTDFNGPLPFLALGFEYYITEKWLAIVNGGYFQLEIGDYDGKLGAVTAKLEYQFTKRWGLGLGYSGFIIDATIKDSDLRTNIEFTYHGIQAYGTLRF